MGYQSKTEQVVTPVVGITFGTWDLLHVGHIRHLKECKQHCDFLIVGLQVDPSVDRPEKNKPILTVSERYELLSANKYVDAVIIYEREHQVHALDMFLPVSVRFMGGDHKDKKHHLIKAKVYYTDRSHSYSSSNLRKKIYDAEQN